MAKKHDYFEDDGRTIADMNVDGMPWYVQKRERPVASESEPLELSRKEKWAMMGGILKATILVTLAFGLGFFLFILFCVLVFR